MAKKVDKVNPEIVQKFVYECILGNGKVVYRAKCQIGEQHFYLIEEFNTPKLKQVEALSGCPDGRAMNYGTEVRATSLLENAIDNHFKAVQGATVVSFKEKKLK